MILLILSVRLIPWVLLRWLLSPISARASRNPIQKNPKNQNNQKNVIFRFFRLLRYAEESQESKECEQLILLVLSILLILLVLWGWLLSPISARAFRTTIQKNWINQKKQNNQKNIIHGLFFHCCFLWILPRCNRITDSFVFASFDSFMVAPQPNLSPDLQEYNPKEPNESKESKECNQFICWILPLC